MKTGLILTLLAAVAWAINSIIVRKVTDRTGEAITCTIFSIYTGALFFFLILLIKGDLPDLADVSGTAFLKLSAAAIIANLAGRFLNYSSIRLIGANKSGPLISITPFFTVIFAVLFLNESLGIFLVFGIILIIFGVILVSLRNQDDLDKKDPAMSGKYIKGIILALVTAVSYGTSSVMIKSAVTEIKSPFISVFLTYATSAIFISFLLFKKENRIKIRHIFNDSIIITVIIAGFVTSTSGLLFQSALTLIPVSLAAPLLSTNILMVYIISFFINRRLEVFTLKVFLGMVSVVLGVFLIFQ